MDEAKEQAAWKIEFDAKLAAARTVRAADEMAKNDAAHTLMGAHAQSEDAGEKSTVFLGKAITSWWQIKKMFEGTDETDHEVMIQFAGMFREYLAAYETHVEWIRIRDWADVNSLRAQTTLATGVVITD